MLQTTKSSLAEQRTAAVSDFLSPADVYAGIVGFVRRQYLVVFCMLVLTLALGAVYILSTPPEFTGRAVLVIDTHNNQFLQAASPLGDLPIDSAAVDTQIEILKSQKIALSVVKDLHLNEDPEFIYPQSGILSTVTRFVANTFMSALGAVVPSTGVPINAPAPQDQLTQSAVGTFQSRLNVERVGLTYAINIDFRSLSPDRAAQIANAVADAYIVDSLEAKYEVTRRAGKWLEDRLKELREQASTAERAVVDYKAKHNIIDTGGELMNQQQLAELNSQLVQVRAATAEAKARLDRVQQIVSNGDIDPTAAATGTVADTLQNPVITQLREKYLEYAARADDWATKYGPTHLAVVNLRSQMLQLRRSIFEELKRTAETYQSDYQIAKTREDSIERSLQQTVAQSQTTNEAQVTLHNLESSAQTYRALYDNFLQRYMESVQQQSFPISNSRVISQAVRPGSKSSPKSMMVMALAALGGCMLGLGLGVLREISDRMFRTSTQVTEHLQADCIALIPTVEDGRPVASNNSKKVDTANLSTAPRVIVRDTSLRWTAVDTPLSRFAEAIRAVKVAVDVAGAGKEHKLIGITSSLPNEGKSTIAVSLVALIAQGGARSLLIDCDLRNPSLTKSLAPKAKAGLLHVVSGKAKLEDVIWKEPGSGLNFVPAVVPKNLHHSSEVLASDGIRTFFDEVRRAYDYVIVDLSPLAPVVDVRVVAPLVDSFLFVIEWGRTRIDVVEHALSNARPVYENLLGVVLNKTDMQALGRYESSRENYYYHEYYSRYGYTD